jgi:hypothetical protein
MDLPHPIPLSFRRGINILIICILPPSLSGEGGWGMR